MSSKPLNLPGKHLINTGLLAANLGTVGLFLGATTTPLIAAGCLAGSTLFSFIKGYTLTAAIGGADMRSYSSQFGSMAPILIVILQLSSSPC